jgi:hypothetical protein
MDVYSQGQWKKEDSRDGHNMKLRLYLITPLIEIDGFN